MKKILTISGLQLLISIIGLTVLMSCSDIINSDKNLNITTQTLFNVKADQEKNVIMPLKAGKKWHYEVTEFYSDGTVYRKYLDSVYVSKDTTIDGNKWFLVRYPMLKKDGYVLMTNTNLGLWFICKECNNQSYLLAQYPNTERFSNDKFLFTTQLNNGSFFKDSCTRYIDVSFDTTRIKQYINSRKYTQSLTFSATGRTLEPYMAYNFLADTGLVRHRSMFADLADNNSKPQLMVQYEIADMTKGGLIQNIFEIDFGPIRMGDSQSGNYDVLSNFSGDSVQIQNIDFKTSSNMNLVILPYDKILHDQSEFYLPLKITPASSGPLEANLLIQTNAGEFNIKVKCTSK